MNENQRNGEFEAQEQIQAQRTIRALQSGDAENAAREDRVTFELGRQLRHLATNDLPEANPELRQCLLEHLSENQPTSVFIGKQNPTRKLMSTSILVLAAAILLAIGAWVIFLTPGQPEIASVGMKYQNATQSDLWTTIDDMDNDGIASGNQRDGQSLKMEALGEFDRRDRLVARENARASDESLAAMPDGRGRESKPATSAKDNLALSSSPIPDVQQGVDYYRQQLATNGLDRSSPSDGFGVDQGQGGMGAGAPSGGGGMGGMGTVNIQGMGGLGKGSGGMYNSYSGNGYTGGMRGQEIAVTKQGTVVAVPDGGTVLLGGIKRQSQSTPQTSDFSSSLAANSPWGDSNPGEARVSGRYEYYFGELDRQSANRHSGLSLSKRPTNEQYAPIQENKFIRAMGGDAISTFSIDVDTAAYANMRRFINSGQAPPRDSVRIEELINYFQYDYPQPKGDDPFSVNMELATCPWNHNHKLLRVGLKGKEIHAQERPATNVVFLLDVSGSMNSEDKLPLLKRGFQLMVNQLNENDQVSIVTYAGNAGVVLEPTRGDKTKKINEAIEQLSPGGSTHGSAGIELAYQLAQQNFIHNGVNKVILATDGDLNVGITQDDALVKLIKDKASEGVFLTVLGFGTGNLKDAKMEQLADNGNGLYAYIDSLREAHKVLVEQMSGSLVTIAKDVKIQIEFNPAEVIGYRLVGYENRMLATEDFDNDQKDAGEIGAGHTVTAIYELMTTDKQTETLGTSNQALKYQAKGQLEETELPSDKASLTKAAKSGELLTLALRYKQPDENVSKRIEFAIENQERSFQEASDDFRFAASVASFGMLLRGSQFAGDSNITTIQEIATGAVGDDPSGYRSEFIDLVRKSSAFCR